MKLQTTEALRKQLAEARAAFKRAGGRGVDRAEEIDALRFQLRSRASHKGWRNRKAAAKHPPQTS
jgi:hypothetical protein